MANLFTIAGGATVDLTALADELRAQISALPPGSPLLKAQELASQSGVQEYLVVVRGNEDPHIHPDGDLLITVLEGHGFLQLTARPSMRRKAPSSSCRKVSVTPITTRPNPTRSS